MTATYEPRVYYFGRWWDAPAFDDAIEAPVPVGEPCGLCPEPIAEGDSGTWQVFGLSGGLAGRPVHIECWIRQGLGSPAHVQHRCSCTGAEEPVDERTWREQGREVIRLIGRGAYLDA